jgi:hypothetical protein
LPLVAGGAATVCNAGMFIAAVVAPWALLIIAAIRRCWF